MTCDGDLFQSLSLSVPLLTGSRIDCVPVTCVPTAVHWPRLASSFPVPCAAGIAITLCPRLAASVVSFFTVTLPSANSMYQKSAKTCAICHEECDGPCTGKGPGKCVRCKHVRDGPYCVAQCPATKYNSSGECLPCHENCVDGCSGPANTVGEGGCFSCEGAIVGSNEEVVSI